MKILKTSCSSRSHKALQAQKRKDSVAAVAAAAGSAGMRVSSRNCRAGAIILQTEKILFISKGLASGNSNHLFIRERKWRWEMKAKDLLMMLVLMLCFLPPSLP